MHAHWIHVYYVETLLNKKQLTSGANPQGERGGDRPPPLHGCWPKNRDARPIKSKFYHPVSYSAACYLLIACLYSSNRMHKNSPFWAQKSKIFSGEGAQPLPQTPPQWRGRHPLHTTYPLGAFGASILAPTAFDLGASPLLATPSGSAPD